MLPSSDQLSKPSQAAQKMVTPIRLESGRSQGWGSLFKAMGVTLELFPMR